MSQKCFPQMNHHYGACGECQPQPAEQVEMCEVCTDKPATELLQRVPLCSSCWATCAIFLGRTDRSYCAYIAARDKAQAN